MDTVTFPGGVKLGARRRLLGIPLAQLARDAALQPELLRRLEAGEFDPRSLHLNYEIMLRLEQPEAVAAAGADVMDMVSRSRAIHRDQWAPSRGGWEKMREWWAFSLLYRLDPWLTGWLTRPGR